MTDANQDDNFRDSSLEDNQQEDLYVGDDANAQDLEDEELEEESSEEEERTEGSIPFHEHPRFQEMVRDKRELKEQNSRLLERLDALERQTAQKAMYENATPQQKAILKLKQEHGFLTREDIEPLRKENSSLKEELKFDKFLQQNPEALANAQAIRALASSPQYSGKSYDSIYKEVFQGVKPGRKVVGRKVRTGMKSKSSPTSRVTGSKVFTKAQIEKMSLKEFKKHKDVIKAQMQKGLIK